MRRSATVLAANLRARLAAHIEPVVYAHCIIALAPALMAYKTIAPAAKNGIMGSAAVDFVSGFGLSIKAAADLQNLPGNFLGSNEGILV